MLEKKNKKQGNNVKEHLPPNSLVYCTVADERDSFKKNKNKTFTVFEMPKHI